MTPFDMKTVIISYVISNALCVSLLGSLWRQNRQHFAGIGFWLANALLQCAALLLVALRGALPDLVSMTGSNTLIIGGTILLYIGLERFVEKPGPQVHNAILLAIFSVIHAWFVLVIPSLAVRNILFSLGLLIILAQCVWLMLSRVKDEMRPVTRSTGLVFAIYSLVSASRIGVDLVVPPGNDFFHSTMLETALVMLNQMLFVALTFSLLMMVNRRLLDNLQYGLDEVNSAGEALRRSEAQYRSLISHSPDHIVRFDREFRILLANPSVLQGLQVLLGPKSEAEMIGKTYRELGLPAEQCDTWEQQIQQVFLSSAPQQIEYAYPTPEGVRFYDWQLVPEFDLDGQPQSVLSQSRDITLRRQMEEQSQKAAIHYRELIDSISEPFFALDENLRYTLCNAAAEKVLGIPSAQVIGKTIYDVYQGEWVNGAADVYREVMARQEKKVVVDEFSRDGKSSVSEITIYPLEKGVSAVFKDISERRQAEAVLQKSEQQYRQMFTEHSAVKLIIDPATTAILQANPAAAQFYGYPVEVLQTMSMDQINLLPREAILAEMKQAQQRERNYFTFQHRLASGEVCAVEVYSTPMDINGRGVLYSIIHDITARKRAEEALEKRIIALTRPLGVEQIAFEDLFKLEDIQHLQDEFASATGVASLITHTDGVPITQPSNFCRLCKDIIRETPAGRINCVRSDALIGQPSSPGPSIQPCMSGGLWDAGAVIMVGGYHIANWLIGQVRDETQNEQLMRDYAQKIGADADLFIEAFREVPSMSREQFGRVADALFTLANQLSNIAYQNVQQARFIAERQQAEDALKEAVLEARQSQAQEKALFVAARAVLQQNDFKVTARHIFDTCKGLIGAKAGYVALLSADGDENDVLFLDPGEHIGMVDPSLSMPIRGLRREAYLKDQVVFENDFSQSDWIQFSPSGYPELKNVMFTPLVIEGKSRGLLGLANKPGGFTQEDASIAAAFGDLAAIALRNSWLMNQLRESEERYHSLFDNMTEGFALHELVYNDDGEPCDYRFLDVNRSFENLTGLRREDLIGKCQGQVLPDEDPYWFKTYSKVVLTGESIHLEHASPALHRYYDVFAYRPAPHQFAVIFMDITARRQVEEKLALSLDRLNLATAAASLGIWDWDITKNQLTWDDRMYELYGVRREAFSGAYEAWLAGVHPDDCEASDEVSLQARLGKREYDTEFRIIWPDGTIRWLKAYGKVIWDSEGSPIRMTGINYDITKRKQTENALIESEERFRLSLKNAPVTVAAQDTDLRFLWAYNQRTVDPQSVIGKTDTDIFAAQDAEKLIALKRKVLETGQELSEQVWLDRNGAQICLDIFIEPLRNQAREITGVGIATVDLTPIKLVEKSLKQSLEEKEMLLRELNHRTKNNLNIVNSLIQLQAETSDNEHFKALALTLEDRLHSISLVHGMLYRSHNLSQINLAEYARELVENLASGFRLSPEKIAIGIDAMPIVVGINAAIPCGQILNELISNAFKYAFPGDRKGHLNIRIHQGEGGQITLCVSDDGIGFPPNYNQNLSTSLGMTILQMLTKQLRGEITFETTQGVTCEVRFTEGKDS